jgi:SOS regulatory protein LexA
VGTDSQYLSALRAYYAAHGVLPSYAAIGRLVGMSSKASVAEMVGRLKRDRFLDSTPDRRLRPGRRFHERPVTDHVRAGVPSASDAPAVETINLDSYLIRDRQETVLVRVKGDSMVDAGIRNGDIAVVERRPEARSGQIVVAVVDGEFTLKRLAYDRGRPVLVAENAAYAAIRPRADLQIFGVLVGLARSYR